MPNILRQPFSFTRAHQELTVKAGGETRTYIQARIAIEDHGYSTPCWIWQRSLDAYGYAQALFGPPIKKVAKVHRVSYEAFVGQIPDGLVMDHLCRNRACVNPEHLEPVTNGENQRRSRGWRMATHCKRGHELSPENRKANGACRLCGRIWYAENRSRILRKMAAARKPAGVGVASDSDHTSKAIAQSHGKAL